ncbi:MAG TPA: site-specific integrase [Gammaproteobacteria bacterium]|nr:site-specific integrase [Gammaproteobacteria bacterium]
MASIRKRTRKDGTTSYLVEIRMKGHPPQRATFARLTDARKWEQDTESAIRGNRYFKTREAQKHTLADMVDRYIKDVLPTKPKQIRVQKGQLEWFKDEIGANTLADVTPAKITECRDKLLSEINKRGIQRSPATVVRYLSALSHCFTIAVNEWCWLEDSPMRKVKKPKEPRGRVRFLSEDESTDDVVIEGERTRLLKACKDSSNEYLYIVVVLALSTGMRKNEIISLTWQNVDLNRGRITLYETKNGEIRVVPVSGLALELLKERAKARRLHTELLFPSKVHRDKPQDIRAPWVAALKKAKIEDFRFHDLRHSAASYLAMSGASLTEIADILGHKTLQMVKRYSHLSEAHTASVISKLDQRMFGNDK